MKYDIATKDNINRLRGFAVLIAVSWIMRASRHRVLLAWRAIYSPVSARASETFFFSPCPPLRLTPRISVRA